MFSLIFEQRITTAYKIICSSLCTTILLIDIAKMKNFYLKCVWYCELKYILQGEHMQ